MCAIAGGDKLADFFKFDWKSQIWNLVFVLGSVIGGYIAVTYLSSTTEIKLSADTVASLQEMGFKNPGSEYLPDEIFGIERLKSIGGLIILLLGGFLVGFGARWAGGCTSGHAISGMSDLQIPSLIAVIGFFLGGLVMTFLILPLIF